MPTRTVTSKPETTKPGKGGEKPAEPPPRKRAAPRRREPGEDAYRTHPDAPPI